MYRLEIINKLGVFTYHVDEYLSIIDQIEDCLKNKTKLKLTRGFDNDIIRKQSPTA